MIDYKLKYEAVIFVEASQLVPNSDYISKFAELFKDRGLVPNVFQEFVPPNPPASRLRLSSSDNKWSINFGLKRISIEKNLAGIFHKDLGEFSEFCNEVISIYKTIHKIFPRKATRLAGVSHYLLKELSEQKMEMIYDKFLCPFSVYNDNRPFEWNSRSVCRLNEKWGKFKEDINLITQINRVQGQMDESGKISEIDRIQIIIDGNSLPQKNEERFDIKAIEDFYKHYPSVPDKVLKDILEIING